MSASRPSPEMASAQGDYRYRVYGLGVRSDLPLPELNREENPGDADVDIRIGRVPHGVVGQQKLAKLPVEIRSLRFQRRLGKPGRRRIGIGIKRRLVVAAAARPKARARHLVRIGLAGDVVGHARHAAGMARRGAARIPAHIHISLPP